MARMKKCICTTNFKCFECLKKELDNQLTGLNNIKQYVDTRVIKLPMTPEQKRKQFKVIKGGKNDNNQIS